MKNVYLKNLGAAIFFIIRRFIKKYQAIYKVDHSVYVGEILIGCFIEI